MTNCWGKAGENQCDSPCINTINPLIVVKALKELMEPFGV